MGNDGWIGQLHEKLSVFDYSTIDFADLGAPAFTGSEINPITGLGFDATEFVGFIVLEGDGAGLDHKANARLPNVFVSCAICQDDAAF